MEFKNNELLRQFECKCEINYLVIEYSIQERKLFLTKLDDSKCQESQFVDDSIIEIINWAVDNKLRIVPVHPKVASFFKKNPTQKEHLAVGIKI